MPEPLDLSSEAALCHAAARAQTIRAYLYALLDTDQDVLWLADIACAALLLAAPTDLDMAAWLATADDLASMPRPPAVADTRERPDWLIAQMEDWDGRR